MPGINEGKKRRKQRYVNFIQNDANIVNSCSRSLIGYLKKSQNLIGQKVDNLTAES